MSRPSLPFSCLLLGLLTLTVPAGRAEVPGSAWRSAETVARSVVRVDYVLEKQGRGFNAVDQRAELAALGVIATPGGLVVMSDNIFPEDEDESRIPARPGTFEVRLSDGSEREATLLGRDAEQALTFLQLAAAPGERFPSVQFAGDANLSPGDEVLMVGLLPRRFGHAPRFDPARISSVITEPRRLYDVDAFVQDGAVGSAVVDGRGRVVGILSIDRMDGDTGRLAFPLKVIGSAGRGKAAGYPVIVPSSSLLPLLSNPPQPTEQRPRQRAWMGVTLQEVSPALARHLGVGEPSGVMLTSVWQDSPAESAGFQPEDVIVRFDGRAVSCTEEAAVGVFIDRVQRSEIGKAVPVEVVRQGERAAERLTLTIALGVAPTTAIQAEEVRSSAFGLAAQELTVDIIEARGWPRQTRGALVIEVESGGFAEVGGLRPGDLILAIGDQRVEGVEALGGLLEAAEEAKVSELVFFVLRDPDTLFVVVEPDW
ncbi:MAG: PDZ domain-containing protein [Acidobacteriota bacterium]